MRLPLDRAEGEAADEVALDREPEDRRRQDQDAGERGLQAVLLAGRAALERLEDTPAPCRRRPGS